MPSIRSYRTTGADQQLCNEMVSQFHQIYVAMTSNLDLVLCSI